MKIAKLSELAKGECEFLRYQEGNLYYVVRWTEPGPEFRMMEFPVPVEDSGDGGFFPKMKGIELLRWARKHLEMLEKALDEQ